MSSIEAIRKRWEDSHQAERVHEGNDHYWRCSCGYERREIRGLRIHRLVVKEKRIDALLNMAEAMERYLLAECGVNYEMEPTAQDLRGTFTALEALP